MENIIEMHRSIFQEMEIKANSGISQLREFAKLLEEKMDAERVNARANKKFSSFEYQFLNQTKYGRIFEEMLNVSESKSVQAYDLVKSISQDIYEPLKEMMGHQAHAVTGISYEGRRAMKGTKDLGDQLSNIKREYFHAKGELSRAVTNYEKFKAENPQNDKNTEFYKIKLFKQMNAKMRVWQEKNNLYSICVKRANENLKYYTEKMQGLVRIYSQMSYDRNQIMIDSLNKLVLFETSVDMNLKYDTKMFTKLIEDIQAQQEEERVEQAKLFNKLETPTKNEESKDQDQTSETLEESIPTNQDSTKDEKSPIKPEPYTGIGKCPTK